ncbi:Ig domain containing protein [Staphylococcus phage PG-2021_15]
MAEVKKIDELLKPGETPTITDSLLQVKTLADGFTGTYSGLYSYLVKNEEGNYFVYPVETVGNGKVVVYKKSPIIYTDGEQIHFVVNTLKEPFSFPNIRSEELGSLNKEQAVLQAFLAFAESRFGYLQYHSMISHYVDGFTVNGEPTKDGETLVDETAKATEEVYMPGRREQIKVKGVSFDQESVEVNQNETVQVVPTFKPFSATDKRVTFKSHNTGIAQVDDLGIITGVVEGETTITAISAEGQFRGDIKVTVKPTAGEQLEEPPVEDTEPDTETGTDPEA